MELAQHHFHHILLAEAIPESRASLPLDGKDYEVAYIAKGADTGRGEIVVIL